MSGRPQLDRIVVALREIDAEAALLTSIPSVGYATGHWPAWEMFPGHNPYAPDAPVCVVGADGSATLLLADYYAAYADAATVDVRLFPAYAYTERPHPTEAQALAVREVLGSRVGRLAYEPHTLGSALRAAVAKQVRVATWVDAEAALERVRTIKLPEELDAIREACKVADLLQQTVHEEAEPGRSTIELASLAISRAWEDRGHRFAIQLQIAAGPITGSIPSGEPSAQRIRAGDLVCLDVAPWPNGYWSDSCNGVLVGSPDGRHREAFEVVRSALAAGIAAAVPGTRARDVDRACRDVVRAAGNDYPHHTGHGIGTVHTEAPRITPDSDEMLQAGMVIALEPGIYVEGWAGYRHEHVLHVTDAGPEIITHFEHSL